MPDQDRSDAVDVDAPVPSVSGEETPLTDLKLPKRERVKIGQMVMADVRYDMEKRETWKTDRQDDKKRLEMQIGKADPDFPWPNSSDVRLPSVRIATGATRARFLASVFGVPQITEVDAVGADDLNNVAVTEQFIEFMVTDPQVGLYEKIDDLSEPVVALGDYAAHVHWRRETRFMREEKAFYADPQDPETPLTDSVGEPIEFGDVPAAVLALTEKFGERAQQIPSLPRIEQMVEGEQVVFEGADVDVFDTEDLILPPDAKSVQQADHITHRVWMTVDQITRKRTSGAFNTLTAQDLKAIKASEDRVSVDSGAANSENRAEKTDTEMEGTISEIARNKRENFNWFGKWDIDKDGLEEEVIFTVHGKTGILMRVALLDDVYPHGKRPFIIVTHDKRAGRPFGRGLARTLAALDDSMNTAVNQFFDRGTAINAVMGSYEPGEGVPDETVKMFPGKWIPAAKGSLTPIQLADYTAIFIQFLGFIKVYIEQLTGVNDSTVGRLGEQSRRTATEISQVLGEGNVGFGMKSQRFQAGIGEIILQMFQLYQAFMPDGFELKVNPKLASAGNLQSGMQPMFRLNREDIRGQFQIRLIGDPVSGNKQARQQKSLMMLQIILPIMIQMGIPDAAIPMLRDFMRDFGIKDADEILSNEMIQRVQAQQQMAQQAQQLQTELAKAQFQLEGAKTKAETDETLAIIQDIQSRIAMRQVEAQKLSADIQKVFADSQKSIQEGEAKATESLVRVAEMGESVNGNGAGQKT